MGEEVYPYLIAMGKDLIDKGVNFYDLTMVFKNNDNPIYRDTACHINKAGNNILGETIGNIILKNIK